MPEIKNKKDWWQVVDDNWDCLLEIVLHHMKFAAPAYEKPGDDKSPKTGRTILEELDFLRKIRNPKLVRYFSASWCMASDAYAWSVPGWGAFCDLCSEEWIFNEDDLQGEPKLEDQDDGLFEDLDDKTLEEIGKI